MFKSIKPSLVNLMCTVLSIALAIMKIRDGNWIATGISIFAALFFFGTYARLKKKEQSRKQKPKN